MERPQKGLLGTWPAGLSQPAGVEEEAWGQVGVGGSALNQKSQSPSEFRAGRTLRAWLVQPLTSPLPRGGNEATGGRATLSWSHISGGLELGS